MKLNYNFLFFILLTFFFTRSYSQDHLLFLNGKELEGQLINSTEFETTFKSIKDKEFVIDNFRLFSYSKGSTETVLYKYDTLEGNFLSEKDMRLFVYGERDAYRTYSSTFSNVAGVVVGGVAGYFMHKEQAFIIVTAPLVYTSVTLLFPTKVKQNKLKDLQYLKEDEYLRGHERVARSKRTQNALKSSVAGLGAGFLLSLLVNGK